MEDNDFYLKQVDLEELAKKLSYVQPFSLGDKALSLTYFITSCHEYTADPDKPGYDWYFIQQCGSLNGNNGYEKKWAGTNVHINGETFFVGQGDVCLKYVDFYNIRNQFYDKRISADLIFSNPQAINGETQYSFSKQFSFKGVVGVEFGTEKKQSSSISLGVNYSSSYSFNVQDCTCVQDYQDENGGIGWNYSFRKAYQNCCPGHWQELYPPANLATSTFCPTNFWVWRIPTSERALYHSFKTDFEISLMNTISRFSGSQSPKHIKEHLNKKSITIEVPITFPPLISASFTNFLFDKERASKELHIACEDAWNVANSSEFPSWLKLNKLNGSGQDTVIVVSVDAYNEDNSTNVRSFDIVFRRTNTNDPLDQTIVTITQSPGKIV